MYNKLAALSDNEEHRVGHYILLEKIGWGSFSSVWLAWHTLTGADVAIKVVKGQDPSDPFKEIRSLQLLQHPNIVTLFEMITTKDELYLIQEHVNGGDLLQHLTDRGPMTEEEARHTFRQVISALQYCHQYHIVHRDLKPENILLDRDKNVKVADFGFSAQITQETPLLSKICGTFPYMAPEMLLFELYNEKVDFWSIGVVLSQMLTTTIPFEAQNRVEHKFNILTGRFPVPEFLSLGCQDLLKKLLTLDPDERPAFDDIMKDRWLNMGYADELSPYREPAQEGLNPQIINSMANMGFDKENIITSVTEQKYDPVMGTYLILGKTPPKMKGCIIRVRSCPFPDHNINLLPKQGVQAPGKNDRHPSISPAGLGSTVATPAPHQLVRKKRISPVIEKAGMSTTSSSKEAENLERPARWEAETTTVLPSQKAETTSPLPSREAATTTPLFSREVTFTTVLPSREAETTSPLPSQEATTTTALPSREAETTTFLPSREEMTTTALASREAETTTALQRREATYTTCVPCREAMTTTALPCWEMMTTTALPCWEVTTTTSLPCREAMTTTALPSREMTTTTALPCREATTTTSLPCREATTTTYLPCREAMTTTALPRWEAENRPY
uniref:non-specific serine/threonine protein kinase n=1 Tax=Molossus molossus TaxID=27622 RepID=A0A7J8DTQ4_MOLMO|nr:hypothetical protein HJG59_009124 [Molossus molossus]